MDGIDWKNIFDWVGIIINILTFGYFIYELTKIKSLLNEQYQRGVQDTSRINLMEALNQSFLRLLELKILVDHSSYEGARMRIADLNIEITKAKVQSGISDAERNELDAIPNDLNQIPEGEMNKDHYLDIVQKKMNQIIIIKTRLLGTITEKNCEPKNRTTT